jgi:multidrug efflux pump subunit AcrA (membrane-fusion protein)
MTKTLLLSIFLFGLFACKPKDQQSEEIDKSAYVADKNQVEAMVLKPATFTKQLVSNGKLAASRKSELKFGVGEEIASIKVNNGQCVEQGLTLAKLNTTGYRQKVQQAQTALEKAKLNFQDVLIGMGYELKDSANIPKEKMDMAKIYSGYTNAEDNCRVAIRNLSYCKHTMNNTSLLIKHQFW